MAWSVTVHCLDIINQVINLHLFCNLRIYSYLCIVLHIFCLPTLFIVIVYYEGHISLCSAGYLLHFNIYLNVIFICIILCDYDSLNKRVSEYYQLDQGFHYELYLCLDLSKYKFSLGHLAWGGNHQ